MASEDTKILEFNQYQKSDKAPFIIYADLYGCKNNSENSSTTKVSEHIPSGFSMSTISSFRSIENKYDVNIGPSRQILVPRTSRGRHPPTSPERPQKVLFDHPEDVPI